MPVLLGCRYAYAELWQAIIKRDVEAIREAATTLGVGELYGLFACMVTARSWDSIKRGMEVTVFLNRQSSVECQK
jgi:aarF domain-containing kinase